MNMIPDRFDWHSRFGDLLTVPKPVTLPGAKYRVFDAADLKERQAFYRLAYNNEPNDCSVRALAVACAAPYERAHWAMQEAGRPVGGSGCIGMMRMAAYALECNMMQTSSRGRTLRTAERALRDTHGGFILTTCNHAAGIWNGELIDYARGTLSRVTATYRIEQRR